MEMEYAERQEAHYGQGGIHSSHGPQRFIQRLHQRTTITNRPLYDPGITQGLQRAEEPKILQREVLLAHCIPKDRPNARVRYNLQRTPKGGQ